tara:strand:+ start:12377 stop:13120 length:744 start_codon:yes stop_codon:yes gene_type:complete
MEEEKKNEYEEGIEEKDEIEEGVALRRSKADVDYEKEIEGKDKIEELLAHLRMGDREEYKKNKNSEKFSQFLKDIEDVHIDKGAKPISQSDFEDIYGRGVSSFQPVVIEGKDDELMKELTKGFLVIPGEIKDPDTGVLGNEVKQVVPRAQEKLEDEIRYEMDDKEIQDYNDTDLSNWSFDAAEKEIERLSRKSPLIKELSDNIAEQEQMDSVRLAEREEKVGSPDGRSYSEHNRVGLNFGGWRLKKM